MRVRNESGGLACKNYCKRADWNAAIISPANYSLSFKILRLLVGLMMLLLVVNDLMVMHACEKSQRCISTTSSTS